MDYRISFCTVCMNRLNHLKQTLPQNIEDNLAYQQVEFLVLDYNSQDGLQEWIMSEMSHYIDQGILTYLRVEEPLYFHRSHSRNTALKMASGDILINLDADNYAGKGFAAFVNKQFQVEENMYLIPTESPTDRFEYFGKVCMKKEDYLAITGYDERISGWGLEDMDLYHRLKRLGLQTREYQDHPEFLHCIKHGDKERICNQKNYLTIHSLFVTYTNNWADMIFLYKDLTFERGAFIYNRSMLNKMGEGLICALKDDQLITGTWAAEDQHYNLTYVDLGATIEQLRLREGGGIVHFSNTGNQKQYTRIIDRRQINQAILWNDAAQNFIKTKENLQKKSLAVNVEFGVANVHTYS